MKESVQSLDSIMNYLIKAASWQGENKVRGLDLIAPQNYCFKKFHNSEGMLNTLSLISFVPNNTITCWLTYFALEHLAIIILTAYPPWYMFPYLTPARSLMLLESPWSLGGYSINQYPTLCVPFTQIMPHKLNAKVSILCSIFETPFHQSPCLFQLLTLSAPNLK